MPFYNVLSLKDFFIKTILRFFRFCVPVFFAILTAALIIFSKIEPVITAVLLGMCLEIFNSNMEKNINKTFFNSCKLLLIFVQNMNLFFAYALASLISVLLTIFLSQIYYLSFEKVSSVINKIIRNLLNKSFKVN